MPESTHPTCAKCGSNSCRCTFVAIDDSKSEGISQLRDELVSAIAAHEAAVRNIALDAESQVAQMSDSFNAKRDELARSLKKKEKLWREELSRAKDIIKREIETDDELSLLMSEDEFERDAEGRARDLVEVKKASKRDDSLLP